jgi:hypothetical protein
VLARKSAIALHVLRDVGLLQEEVEFLKADRVAFQLLAKKGFHGFFCHAGPDPASMVGVCGCGPSPQ